MTISRQTPRRILQSVLAGPVLALLGPTLRAFGQDVDPVITSAGQALDVFDFERLARAKLPLAHWGYLTTGVDGNATLQANTAGFANYSLRVRRMVSIEPGPLRLMARPRSLVVEAPIVKPTLMPDTVNG